MGTGLSRPDGSPIDFADNPSDTDIQEATARMMDEWRAATAEADAADKEKKRDRDAKWEEWTEWLDSPEYAREQAEKQTQLTDAFQRLRRRFLREHGARFGLEVPPPSSSDDDDEAVVEAPPPPPPNPQDEVWAAARRLLEDPHAPRSREEAIHQVMAAARAARSKRGAAGGAAAPKKKRGRGAAPAPKRTKRRTSSALHPLKQKVKHLSWTACRTPASIMGRSAPMTRRSPSALKQRIAAKRKARRAGAAASPP